MPTNRVLVVDDDAAIRQLFTTLLRRHGYEVESACDGREGLIRLREHDDDYCAVILDLMMPVTNGFEMLEILEQEKPAALQRIIVTTGVSRNDLQKLDSSRVFALIRKPFDIHELLTKIGECSSRASLVR
jgi:CheY-like chemotaxis protein